MQKACQRPVQTENPLMSSQVPVPFLQVDSFTHEPFAGNPAAVVPLERWERQAASCSGRRARRASRRGGPRALEAYAEMEDLCMGGVACPALAPDGGGWVGSHAALGGFSRGAMLAATAASPEWAGRAVVLKAATDGQGAHVEVYDRRRMKAAFDA